MKRAFAVAMCLAAAACGGSSKSNPTAPETPRVLQGRAVSAIDGSALGAVDIQVGDRPATQTDPNGNFQVDVDGPGLFPTTVKGSPIVERHTSITGPSGDRTRLALIPATFDLDAFNEMFRGSDSHSRLQRWTTAPALVVVASAMKFNDANTDRYEASTDRLTDSEVSALVSHLKEGLTLLTAGTYSSFASVEIEHPASREMVNVQRVGKIVVGRYLGVQSDQQTIGYGTWAEQPDGTVVGGTMWLDRDFDRDDARRRLLRFHELGHALGYNHVTVRPSVMNPAIGPEPTAFDRDGSSIAFQRPVGNTSPDTDPAGSSSTGRTSAVSEGSVRWSKPIR
jgi:hypothetical protein